jgi:hypothetical protein
MANDATAANAAMEGRGFYNRNSATQAAGIAPVLPIWQAAAERVPVGDEAIVIADYGSSQGRNSLEPMAIAIEALRRQAGVDRTVEVIHTDLPSNDFSTLFEVLLSDPASYLAGRSGIYPSAIGRTYFEQILPPMRVHLAWNSWTLQWMSRSPVDAPDHIFAAMSASPDVLQMVRAQQAEDWVRFLRLRSREMRPGARMLCTFVGEDEASRSWRWITGELWGALCDMGHVGLLSDEERLRITVPAAPRRPQDITEPFERSARFEDLVVEHLELTQGPDPHWQQFLETGDREAFAESQSGLMRGFAGPTIRQALSPERDREALVDELFDRCAARLAAAPQQNVHFIGTVVLAKVDE